jgi:hypothetical protein
MSKKSVLIVGDSFSSEQISGQYGWPVLLSQDFAPYSKEANKILYQRLKNKLKDIVV